MIPKKIHYCWFGGKELPEQAKRCIESWKKYCPDYEIIQWNENNYNINKNEYTKYTYENKKFAFLTDYVRLDVIYNEGGIYLDTDVELLKSLDDLLDCDGYIGMEEVGTINTGQGFGAIKGHPFIKENKNFYEENDFLYEDGTFKKVICVKVSTDILKRNGLEEINKKQNIYNMEIYPTEYFCPLKMGTNKLKVTPNTYSIHYFNASWYTGNKFIKRFKYYLIPLKQFVKRILGVN